MESCVRYIYRLNERKFVSLTHLVGCDDFVIFASDDKENFGHNIGQFIQDMIKEAQKSDLHRYDWKTHRPRVYETKNPPNELFHDCIQIIFTVE